MFSKLYNYLINWYFDTFLRVKSEDNILIYFYLKPAVDYINNVLFKPE